MIRFQLLFLWLYFVSAKKAFLNQGNYYPIFWGRLYLELGLLRTSVLTMRMEKGHINCGNRKGRNTQQVFRDLEWLVFLGVFHLFVYHLHFLLASFIENYFLLCFHFSLLLLISHIFFWRDFLSRPLSNQCVPCFLVLNHSLLAYSFILVKYNL